MTNSIAWDLDALVYDLFVGQVDHQLYIDILRAAEPLDGKRIEDVGCGTGNLTKLLPSSSVVRAMDISAVALYRALQKVGPHVLLQLVDFYEDSNYEGNADVAIASRSLYHPDLSRSLGMLSHHLNDHGIAVVAYGMPDLESYLFPRFNGTRSLSPRQAVKALARAVRFVGVDYRFFEAQEFECAGRQHFDDVKIELGGLGTHYVITLKKGE